MPGTVLQTWQVTGLPPFGSGFCCTLETVKTRLLVQHGQQYWLVAKPLAADTVAVWNSAPTADTGPLAGNRNGTGWLVYLLGVHQGAFNVLGTPCPAAASAHCVGS